MPVAVSHQDQGFVHEAFFYRDSAEFSQGVLTFIREGLEGGEPILVVLSAAKIERLRNALGTDAELVSFADMAHVGANPGRIIAVWRQFVDENEGRPIRGVGEPIWAGRSDPELAECHRHESLLNLAFAETPAFRLLCPYDSSALDSDVVEEAERTHPYVSDVRSAWTSGAFRGLDAISAPFAEPLPEAPESAVELRFDADNLGEVRDLVLEQAKAAGLQQGPAKNLVLAVNEIATNSVRHAGGGGALKIWAGGSSLVCQVEDRGRIEDPLVGRRRPVLDKPDGRGVWLANQVCDLVQVRTSEDGNTVRMHMARR